MKIFYPIFLLLFSVSINSQSTLSDGLKVNGVGLGSKYAEVVRKLGKPTREIINRKMDECIGSRIRTLSYPGLKIELDDPGTGYEVYFLEITSAKWQASGATIGDTTTAVQKRFGTHGRTIENPKTNPQWLYSMPGDNPGGSYFYFRGRKLIKMQSGYEMC